ncbi:HEAT repeat domain-containing protein [Oleiharenicola lentus]|uniref:HEAT repeat domain-containing protein n=1 Tax=Oleiharenicola lentus TaxID=2508720 RepID=UPI003F66D452
MMNPIRLISVIIAVVLHVVALLLLVSEQYEWLAIILHIVGSLAWGWGVANFLPLLQVQAWWLPGACALIFPVGGLMASAALIQLLRLKPPENNTQRYVIWSERSQAEWSATLPAGAPGLSIVEILQSPRTQLRRNAILALRDLDPQLAIPLLRKGLQDSDEQVRIYAQNILSTMLERFEGSVKELEQRLVAHPDAVIAAVNLAEQYFELVYLDVAGDDETAAHYLSKALALLERAAEREPNDGRIAFLGLKYSLRARDIVAAQRWLARTQRCNVEVQQVLPWHMELTFLEGNWAKLKEQFAAFTQAGYVNRRIEHLATFWNRVDSAKA